MSGAETTALFTVLLPVHRPPALLPFAIESVLAQRETHFQLCIICDGAPPETVACAREFAERDARIKVFAFEKGERHGELHRHHVLQGADTEFVAQIGDDDLWFPDFLGEMASLLACADFGNLPQTQLTAQGDIWIHASDLGHPEVRRKMLEEKWNMVGPTFAGYRLSAYRRLPEGWSPAPSDIWTDLFMWRKFLAIPGIRFATRFSVQGVKFSAEFRQAWTLAERVSETAAFADRMSDPLARSRFQIKALELLAADQCRIHAEFEAETAARLAEHQIAERAAMTVLEEREKELEAIGEITDRLTTSRSWCLVRSLTPAGAAIDGISRLARPKGD